METSSSRRVIEGQTVVARGRSLAGRLWSRPQPPWGAVLWWAPPVYALVLAISKLPPDSQPLLPDAQGYFERAVAFEPGTWLGGDPREPLWPLAASVPIHVFGADPTVLRLCSVVMFAALVVATQYLAREVVAPRFAILVGAVLASSEWLALQAVSGLREETAALGAVLVCLIAVRLAPGWRGPLLLAALSGLSAMVRWDTLILTVPVVAGALVQHHVGWPKAAVAATLFAFIVAPYCVGNAQTYGDPFYQSNIHSVFFRNIEFAGQPGFPTKAEVAKDAFAGPAETWPHYLFGLHSSWWVVDRTLRGTPQTALTDWTLTVLGPEQAPPPLALPSSSIITQETTLVPWLLCFATAAGLILLVARRTWPIALMLALGT